MKNAEIVRALPNLSSLKYELKTVDAQIAGLQKQREQLDREIRVLDGGDIEVINGIAVRQSPSHRMDKLSATDGRNIYGKCYSIGAIAHEIERSAEVYPNAHTSEGGNAKDWGLKIYGPRKPYGGREETWLNTGWAYKDAVEIARRWVTHNELPSEEQQLLHRTRHKLDPEGRASKRRREAFEAAWLAKHPQLAEEILLGRAAPSAAKENGHAGH